MVPDAAISRSRLRNFVADRMGLHFSAERWTDLQRGLAAAADELGFNDVAACADWLLSPRVSKEQLQVVASHLTVGETYFFRDRKTFDFLVHTLLPELIHLRRSREQRLRLWSAGCCTGEEPYSLAILLHQLIPDLAEWRVTILASDINLRFLRKAAAGIYGEWSFREAPAGFKQRYFQSSGEGRYRLLPEIKEMVTFAPLNLVDDVYPALATETNAMDLIFCRNVLMYFTPAQARKVIANLHHALVDGGWLAVSPSEASQALFREFVTRNSPGVILYQKHRATAHAGEPWTPPATCETRDSIAPTPDTPWPWVLPILAETPLEQSPAAAPEEPVVAEHPTPSACSVAAALYEQGYYAEAETTLLASFQEEVADPQAISLLARALANQGKLTEALVWCDRWIAGDKLDTARHYLRAVILLEQGDSEQAHRSLQRAVYLGPDFVLAHFALGSLARRRGGRAETDRHFRNALHLLGRYQENDILPESDGLTAGRLTETITALTALENTP